MRAALFLTPLALAWAASAVPAVQAETLADALSAAYQSNPTLMQARAQQRQLDETFVQAETELRPTLSLVGQGAYTHYESPNINQGSFDTNSGSIGLSASQTLYSGGKTTSDLRAADASVLAGRQSLRASEADILNQVVGAYMDVRRDASILDIRKANLEVLRTQLAETTARKDVGQVTPTDVAQARAQYAQAEALLATAEGQLRTSRANYQAVVGEAPQGLAPEPDLPGIPDTLDAAFEAAERANPSLAAAQLTETASRAKVASARNGYGPTLSATASAGYVGPISPLETRNYGGQVSAGLTLTQPLYSGGLIASQVRQALEQNNSDRFGVDKTHRDIIRKVANAWSTMVSAKANLRATQEARDAAKLAYDGVHEEYRAGLRTTLDVLLAEQTLRDTEISLATARHDEYLAKSSLLDAIGALNVQALGLAVSAYDPKAAFDKVKSAGGTPLDIVAQTLDKVGAVHRAQ